MSLWTTLLNSGRRLFDSGPEPDIDSAGADGCAPDPNDVGFTAAVVGLGAKMAAADGSVSDNEIMTFARVFRARPEEADNVRRVFALARQTVRGYEAYARRIGKRYRDRPCLLEGVLDGLFQIAGADGVVTDAEMTYLETVSEAFGFDQATFRRIRASHLGPERDDPYHILGVAHDAAFPDIRSAYRQLMSDHHPDRIVQMGAPREFEDAAHAKAAAITAAYARIRAERGLLVRQD
ncbi:MAG: molecular chaperone DjiA [Hyphomonas sp.]|uniref:molecular chaperone DjiA n=1 Tax=Hyphomonas sp. TaxID=87 RepID=UPI0018402A9D|nr:molecular chaperone DjiA [Hyphomonas sp.]MBA3068465.1 molecular chaperone DjiA [Hyphomonas sp.]MBU3919262.1 molecular chaperone DjiA [Alphaproteobacteria bacterium]MBU4060668.1 molecular chaperone DjiA [Alphaproteobacteria bacterium]MBU4164652.1 molecular chaperone DjiA [Alphaproteobacteria bacterium]